MKRLFSSESVTEGHPDKVADRISDAILDAMLAQDSLARVACETFVTTGLVLVGGEITARAQADVQAIVRGAIKDIGYTDPAYGFTYSDCAVINTIHEQSPDIAQAVVKSTDVENLDSVGAGDQGMMFGYACKETSTMMPLPIWLAHGLTRRLAQARKEKALPYLRPDGKSQVTVEYKDHTPVRVDTVIVSAQHDPDVNSKQMERDLIEQVVRPVLGKWFNDKIKILINPSGRFVIGGPPGDTGMTGRKIIVDTYGGYGAHGGGAFSGKDPSKVDRSASYMARYAAKNLVAAGLCSYCELQVAYAIGKVQPVAITLETCQHGPLGDEQLIDLVWEHFDFRPAAIIKHFQLRRPIYQKLSAYGHFGREDLDLPWEKTDKAKLLKEAAAALAK